MREISAMVSELSGHETERLRGEGGRMSRIGKAVGCRVACTGLSIGLTHWSVYWKVLREMSRGVLRGAWWCSEDILEGVVALEKGVTLEKGMVAWRSFFCGPH